MRLIGTQATGVRTPIIQKGDNLIKIVTDAIVNIDKHNTRINNGDIIAVTEAVVAIAQNNYATTDHIAEDIKNKFNSKDLGIIFPIMSRNRFSLLLKGIAKAADKIYVQLSYPNDEMGNNLLTSAQIRKSGVNPYTDSFTEKEFRDIFGYETIHKFTGIDYIEFYKSISDNIEIIFSNDPNYILNFSKNVIYADIHSRKETKAILEKADVNKFFGLEDILNVSVNGSGYNPEYGLMGTNKATEESVKLFPRNCDAFVTDLQKSVKNALGKNVECIIYGDGAFKDPKCGIWELADPVVSPGYTKGLEGTPNELKLKYLADGIFSDLSDEKLSEAIIDAISNKNDNLVGNMSAEGTTPRKITDLLGSLSDLISGSGDKGTPVVLIQGYFDNYSDN